MRSTITHVGGVTRFYEKKEGSIPFLCGAMLTALACAMFPSLVVALLEGEDPAIMGIPIVIGLILGLPMLMRYRLATIVRPPDALAMMAVLWLSCFVFGMLPFVMFGMPLVDALFESASGFTTTGVDVMDYTELPDCILFWRSTSSWIGGIVIILIFMLLMPMVGGGTRTALGNETSGSMGGAYNRSMRLRDAALQFILVYFVLTFVMASILMFMTYSPYEAITLAFCTISTGGFMAAPVEFTPALKMVILVFMFLGATNFYLHYRAMYQRDLSVYRKNNEFMGVVVWCILMSIVLFLILNPDLSGNIAEGYLDSLFMTVSASSTTGFSYEDFGSWHYNAMMVLYILAFVGASSGSTAGGIKVSRLIIAVKAIFRSFSRIISPNAVAPVYMDGNAVPNETVRNTMMVIMLFIVTIIGFSLVFMMCGYDGSESISCSVALISNFGSAVGDFAGGYGPAPDALKLLMVLMMWIGRLEILVALAILSPRVWKEQYRNFKYKRWKSSYDSR